MRILPDVEKLRSLFVHDPDTGNIYKKMGHKSPSGYIYIYVDGYQYPAHRVIWKLETGEDPPGRLVHINGDMSDNRIENLKVAE